MFDLSRLSHKAGNYAEQKRLLTHALKLIRRRGDSLWTAVALSTLSNANLRLRLFGEGIEQAKEAAETFERLRDVARKRDSLIVLAHLLREDNQLDAAEEVTLRVLGLSPEEDKGYHTCGCYRLLGDIYRFRGDMKKAVHHYKEGLQMGSLFNLPDQLFWINQSLAQLFRDEDNFDDAHAHVKQAKTHALGDTFNLGCAMDTHAKIWYRQRRFENAVSEASNAVEAFEKVGATRNLESSRTFLQTVRQAMESSPAIPGELAHISKVSFSNNTTFHAY